jgi:inosine/xanthosine triphosphatase
MIINIASKNPIKIRALEETISQYPLFSDAKIMSLEIDSGVSDQPKSMDETIKGATNRALQAFMGCDYSVGIEDGLMKVPHTKTGYMNVTVCSIYDGKTHSLGLSSAFEYPVEATRYAVEGNMDMNQVFAKLGLTKNPKVGNSEGAIGILTKGRLPRKETAKQAIMMALIQIENPELYH